VNPLTFDFAGNDVVKACQPGEFVKVGVNQQLLYRNVYFFGMCSLVADQAEYWITGSLVFRYKNQVRGKLPVSIADSFSLGTAQSRTQFNLFANSQVGGGSGVITAYLQNPFVNANTLGNKVTSVNLSPTLVVGEFDEIAYIIEGCNNYANINLFRAVLACYSFAGLVTSAGSNAPTGAPIVRDQAQLDKQAQFVANIDRNAPFVGPLQYPDNWVDPRFIPPPLP
jgi:hypothetical protein